MPEQGDDAAVVKEIKRKASAVKDVGEAKPLRRITINFFAKGKPKVKFERFEGEFNGREMMQARTFMSRGYRVYKGDRARASAPFTRKKSVEALEKLEKANGQMVKQGGE